MSALYNLTESDSGYLFTTESGLAYTVFFIECPITDREGNIHTAYSFGFDREGNFENEKFSNGFDEKIRGTVIHIIEEFFKKNGDKAILYFCYDDDGYARHRSILFGSWYRELESDITHIKKQARVGEDMFYGGMLVLAQNPLLGLIDNAFDLYLEDVNNQK